MSSPFVALSVAILRGFVRDRTAVFFAVVFPLMFLVLFGGLLSDQSAGRIDMVVVGQPTLIDDQIGDDTFDATFDVTRSDDLAAALREVRAGDVDVAVEQQDDTLVAHYSQTDPAKAGVVAGTLRALVDGANVDATGQRPTYALEVESVEDDSLDTIQYFTPGLLGWAVAMSAALGAAATLQGWRQTKLMRRLQLAPVSTRTVVAARVSVTVAVSLVQMGIFIAVGASLFGLVLTGAWWMAVPLLVVGTLCFMAIGLLAGALTTTQESAANAANFLVLPMAFLSGSFFALDGAPRWIQVISDLLPLKHLNDGMLDVMVRGEPWTAALAPMAILTGFAIVITSAAARLFRWDTA